jgi:hypothetical protein
MPDSQTHSTREKVVASILAVLGGASAGWYLWVYLQGHYNLYEGFKRNEYFEPTGGMVYLAMGLIPWVVSGALSGLALLWLLARAAARYVTSDIEVFRLLRYLGIPFLSLSVHPLLGLLGVPATLIPIFHGIVAVGITAGLVSWSLFIEPEAGDLMDRACRSVLLALILIHFILLSWFNIRQFHALNLGYSDSGQVEESLSQTLRGNFMLAYNQ